VAPQGKRFDVFRGFRIVAEDFAQPIDCFVDAVFEVDVSALRPEALLDLFAGEYCPGAFEEGEQNLKGLFL
ncbi:hypothetical protein WDZ92_29630, partial [Nostoc sp. NIES-2111]